MRSIQTISRRWSLLLATLCLMACGSAAAPPSHAGRVSDPTPRATMQAAPPMTEAAQATPTSVSPRAPSPAILVQQEDEPTFSRVEMSEPFGRFPPFTLLADGTVLYVDEGQPPSYGAERAMRAQLSPKERDAFVRQVLDLGFARLQTYTDNCGKMPNTAQQMCVADASFTILRVRMPGGTLREVKIYADFTDDPQALQAIRTLLAAYRHPHAVPYVPGAMALFVKPGANPTEATPQPWPLDPALLRPPAEHLAQWAIAVKGDAVAKLLAALPRNMDDVYVRQGESTYELYLVPWLPGVDYSNVLPGYRQ